MKDKVRLEDINGLPGQLSEATDMVTGDFELARKDAVDALAALGYGVSEASKAVSQVTVTEDMTAEEILKLALKFLF